MNVLPEHSRIIAYLILLACVQGFYAQITDTYTISKAPDYKNQRDCAQGCLRNIASGARCQYPYQNQCVCASHVRGDVTSFLSSCALGDDNACLGKSSLKTEDYSSMVLIFDNYCAAARGSSSTTTEAVPKPSTTAAQGPSITSSSPSVTASVTVHASSSSATRTAALVTYKSFSNLFTLWIALSVGTAVYFASASAVY